MAEIQKEQYLTPKEVAEMLRVSVDVIYRMFEDVPGVVVLVKQGQKRARPYRTMRIPASAIEFYRVH